MFNRAADAGSVDIWSMLAIAGILFGTVYFIHVSVGFFRGRHWKSFAAACVIGGGGFGLLWWMMIWG